MKHKLRADIIAAVHIIWVVFGLASLPLLFVIPWWSYVTLGFIAVNVVSWAVFRDCWLRQAENKLRKDHDPTQAFEDESFIQHYLKKYFGIKLSRNMVRALNYTFVVLLLVLSIAQLV